MAKGNSPSNRDKRGVHKLGTQANNVVQHDGTTLNVRIASPYNVRTKAGPRQVTTWPFLCTYDRAGYYSIPDQIERTHPTGKPSEAERREAARLVDALCWCEARVVRVRQDVVNAGRTEECGDGCYKTYKQRSN